MSVVRSMSLIGSATAAAYAVNAIHYGWSPFTRDSIDDFAAWGISLALLILYWAGYRVLLQVPNPVSLRVVLVPALVLLAIAIVTIPYDSTDVFQYMGMGWAQAHYGLNPYTNVLRDIPGVLNDPMIKNGWMQTNKNAWLDLPLVYGFVFASLIKGIAWLGQGSWWLTLALLKLVNAAAYLGASALLWFLSGSLGQRRRDVALYLFTWSPLILLHHIANAHNDLLVGYLVLLAIYFTVNRRGFWAPAVLVIATMLKYATFPIIPIALVFVLRREGWVRAALSATVATAVGVALSLPYLQSIAHFRFDLIMAQLSKTTAGSLYSLIFYLYRATSLGSLETFGSILKAFLWVLALGLIAREGYRFRHIDKPSIEDLISSSSWILFLVIFVGSSQFYSWYIGMFLPLALLLGVGDGLRQLAVLLSGTHVLSVTSLSRKGIGYFLLTTGVAFGLLRRSRRPRTAWHSQ